LPRAAPRATGRLPPGAHRTRRHLPHDDDGPGPRERRSRDRRGRSMTFLSSLALAIGLLVVVPYVAHRLRRQRATVHDFAPVHLVPAAPPQARRRAKLEDRPLLLVRAASILALAFLGASPFVRCSRVAMSRSGTSVAVAIVLDDS